ncbi:MAG TPA: sulfatase-like hydrolase/transferase, partial [Kofleriaceae bacterium]|nr:sulfatase-like hydrolase/transferase [Kofleriaceae bacterium]
GAELARQTADWIAARDRAPPGRPLFVWVHFIEPHRWDLDYKQRDHGGTQQTRYDMALEAVDEELGTVLDAAWTDARRSHTIVVVTSDHGEGLGDHNAKYHSSDLYNSQIHVPLVIAGPGVAARRLKQPIGLTTLVPTLLDLAGYVPPGPPTLDQTSLAPLLRGQRSDEVDDGFAYASMIRDRSVARSMRAIVVGRNKLIEFDDGARYEVYDLLKDRNERHDLSVKDATLLSTMQQRLRDRAQLDDTTPF